MIRNILARDMTVPPETEKKILDKTDKFDRWFGDEARMEIKLEPDNREVLCEITLQIRRHYYRAEARSEDILQACEAAISIMEGQIRKHKTKMKRRQKQYDYMQPYFEANPMDDVEADEDQPKIVREKTFPIHPMDIDEAVMQMELLGHPFFLFLNAETGKVALLYERKKGDYGLIEPQY